VQPFEYRQVNDAEAAVAAMRGVPSAQFIGGGTNLVDYMTLGVLQPQRLVDINPLADRYAQIELGTARLRLGALVRMGQAEDHPLLRQQFPVLRDALVLAASRQIRNMATIGGNILQRTRCEYFRGPAFACNKRLPGSGCAARGGLDRAHAVLGTSEHCIAAYAGDLAQALLALEARVVTLGGRRGARTIPLAQLHRLPGETPHLETTLAPGELITHIEVPTGPWTRRSRYLKVRDRESYQFALCSAAVAMDLQDGVMHEVRIALGGVATVPWRAHAAEALLRGKVLDEPLAQRAAMAAFTDAMPGLHNGFKVPLGQRTLVRALFEVAAMEVT
jgi:xanthine dehydrogenase YagS FAD-binding subunit